MENHVYGYIRVSSADQNEERQVIAMRKMEVPEKTCISINNRARISTAQNTKNWSSV